MKRKNKLLPTHPGEIIREDILPCVGLSVTAGSHGPGRLSPDAAWHFGWTKAIHPGEILRAEFMEPLKLSMNRLAADLRVPVTRIAEIVHELRGITPDTALRLARYFNTSAGFWMNLQTAYDLEVAEDELSRTIEREVRPASMTAATSIFRLSEAYSQPVPGGSGDCP